MIQDYLWTQFGAALDTLANAIAACPDELWEENPKFHRLTYHTLYFTDYYLSDTPGESDFRPPAPFTSSEFEDELPPRVYRKDELLRYLDHCRERLHDVLSASVDDLLTKRFQNKYKDYATFELVLYNMRHVQHHAAQLNMLLREHEVTPPRWVSRTTSLF